MNYSNFLELLLTMENAKTITEAADKLYYSQSKTSKLIKKYEEQFNIKLYEKNKNNILSYEGKKILDEIYTKYREIEDYFKKYQNNKKIRIGIDENIVNDPKIMEILDNSKNNVEYIFANSLQIIKDFNNSNLDEIICSDDFEHDYQYHEKEYLLSKKVVRIFNKSYLNKEEIMNIFIFEKGCPIRKKLEKKFKYTQEIYRIDKIEKLVSLNQGIGYLFKSTEINNPNITIEEVDNMKITYFKYKRK
ncbi:MAG: LysR family transcriptional regulator [Mycoplasmatales bacterium]